MTGTTWFRIRLALIIAGFVGTFFVMPFVPVEQFDHSLSSLPPSHLLIFGIFALLSTALLPFMLLFVISLQVINPMSDDTWSRPTHGSNPFRIGNPLLFFHFAAYYTGVGSIAYMITSLWLGWIMLVLGALGLAQAVMLLVGVHLCMRVFKTKMAPE